MGTHSCLLFGRDLWMHFIKSDTQGLLANTCGKRTFVLLGAIIFVFSLTLGLASDFDSKLIYETSCHVKWLCFHTGTIFQPRSLMLSNWDYAGRQVDKWFTKDHWSGISGVLLALQPPILHPKIISDAINKYQSFKPNLSITSHFSCYSVHDYPSKASDSESIPSMRLCHE